MVQTIQCPRLLAALRDRLPASPAVTILGTRQAGKTTIDPRTRDRIVEALRRQWDIGVDRPVVDSELVESCSRAPESG